MNSIRTRSRQNLRRQAAFAVFISTALFFAPGIAAFANGNPDFSTHKTPIWVVVIVVIALFISADILATMSMTGNRGERKQNRLCLCAFALTIIGYVIVAILASFIP
jgi:uncharacterized protein YqgC (DUF456 family)